MKHHCLTDEQLIDALLRKLSLDEQQQVNEHLAQCSDCFNRQKEWEQMLSYSSVRSAPFSPLSRIKKRILQTLYPVRERKSWLGQAAPVLSILFIVGCFTWMANDWPAAPSNPSNEGAVGEVMQQDQRSHQLVQQSNFLIDPHTETFVIDPSNELIRINHPHTPVNGNLWINHQHQQLLLLLEGLEPLPENDYQVWMIVHKQINNAGLFDMMGSHAVFYWSGDQPATEIDMIRISIEPKGGSLRPTGPEALTIPLRHQ